MGVWGWRRDLGQIVLAEVVLEVRARMVVSSFFLLDITLPLVPGLT